MATENPTNDCGDATYADYYWRAINTYLNSGKEYGLKLVLGPTGLGKTYAIPLAIKRLRAEKMNLRCAYITHRHILLQEMESMLTAHGIPFVYLKSNTDIVSEWIADPAVFDFIEYLDQEGSFQTIRLTRRQLEDLIRDIEALNKTTGIKLKSSGRDLLRDQLSTLCSKVIKAFTSMLAQVKKEELKKQLLLHPLIWKLFPYIAFRHDPRHPVLLVTTQKLLQGFFDGRRSQRISALRNIIIFLDEFEIQEQVMLTALSTADGIRNPFEFVRLFHDEMTIQERQGGLTPLSIDSTGRADARQKANHLLNSISDQALKYGYPGFPRNTRFTIDTEQFDRNNSITIFQSNAIVQTVPFFLLENENSWHIVRNRPKSSRSSRQLLTLAAQAAIEILEFFAFLQEEGLEAEWREWVDQCYNRRNDHLEGAYHNLISLYGQFRRPLNSMRKLRTTTIKDTLYFKGMSLYRVQRGVYNATLPDEVKILQRTLPLTPEYLLWQLTQQNLVFGISATGDLPRLVGSFDLSWLNQYASVLPVDAADRALIEQLRIAKTAQRGYAVQLELARTLPLTHRLHRYLSALAAEGAFTHQDNESEVTIESRQALVNRFMETLRWITHESKSVAHLVFVNSFASIEQVLDKKCRMYEQDLDDMIDQLQVMTRRSAAREYQVRIDGSHCAVVLLDADKAREMGANRFQYLQAEGPLVVVTQYETASNGVNLEWMGHPDFPGVAFDFEGIHLLEGKHFYIGKALTADDNQDADPHTLFAWKLWKLTDGRQIARYTFENYLKNWQISQFNAVEYKKTDDYLLNQIALFHQAFGRVDRKRIARTHTEVRLSETGGPGSTSDGVFQLIERYLLKQGAIGEHRDNRNSVTSPLILKIHEAVLAQGRKRQVSNMRFREDLATKQQASQTLIAIWVQALGNLRMGLYNEDESKAIKHGWISMREAMLHQDYHFLYVNRDLPDTPCLEVRFPRDFVVESAYIQQSGIIHLDRSFSTIFRDASSQTIEYHLNDPYRHLADCEPIQQFFTLQGYPLSLLHTTPGYCFVPHAIQAILTGAIGEAAIEALLNSYHIRLENPLAHPDALFELFDHKVAELPLYLDAKRYRLSTIQRMSLAVDNPDFHDELNSARQLQKWYGKWQRIVEVTKERHSKLVIINLESDDNRVNQYWDMDCNPVKTYEEAAIALIQGALDISNPSIIQTPFLMWVGWVKDALAERKIGGL